MRFPALTVFALVLAACGTDDSSNGVPAPGAESDPATPAPGGGSSGAPASSSAAPAASDGGPSTPAPAAGPPVRFVAMGDTGVGTNDQLKVGNTISAFCKTRGCDFVQLLGDNLYPSGAPSVTDPIWQTNFETPYAAINLPFWVVLGNHDYGANGAGMEFAKAQNEIDYTAKSTKWKLPSSYWHRTDPSNAAVEMFGLDTNMSMFSKDAEQRSDVAAWLAASKAEWKIAFGHHPYMSNGPHGNAGNYDAKGPFSLPIVNGSGVKSFLEDTICGKVDLYLSGHDHSRQWLNVSCQGTELAVSGAGAKATDLGGTNPTLFESLELGFLYIVIEGKKLTAEFIDENGKTEFTHTITKP